MSKIDHTILNKFADLRVLVIGDLMLDHYLWGDIHRISPEAPVPVVNATGDTYNAGGAANVALNLSNLGIQASILGYCAADEAGSRLKEILKENGVNVINAECTNQVPTIIKTRVFVRNQQLCRIDREAGRDGYQIDKSPGFGGLLKEALNNADAVIISDYAKGVITQSLVDSLFEQAASKPGLLVAIDPKPSRHLIFKNAGVITPNKNEALQLAGLPPLQSDEKYPLEEVCKRIHDLYNPQLLVITLGADGMVICQSGNVLHHLPTEAREVFDVSGAGDTVIATITASLAAGLSPSAAAWLANGAAGRVVAHIGTAPVKIDELKKWIDDQNK